MIYYGVNIDAFPFDRPSVGKGAHPVDEFYNPVGFLADKPGQRRSESSASASSNCAAPLMPDNGFLISCASMDAIAATERAPPR